MAASKPPKPSAAPATWRGTAYSVAMAALAAAAIGGGVFLAARFAGLVRTPLLYHGCVFGAFFALYLNMPGGFNANYNLPATGRNLSLADILYYTAVVHSTAGFGEITPTTFYARVVTAAHLGLVFLGTASLIPLGR